MGKKIRRKNRTQKQRVSNNSNNNNAQKKESEPTNQNGEEVSVAKERRTCTHLGKGIDLDALSARIDSSKTVRCEDCREGAVDKRGGKGKAAKKRGSGSGDSKSDTRAVWVCLACGHYACGGVGLPTNPQCHALRHTRQTRHPIVVQYEKPQLRWCFPCNTLIQVDKVEENGEMKDVFSDALKLIKGQTEDGPAETENKPITTAVSGDLGRKCGYSVRGLLNIGNTCFLNSVLQNLLAMDKLRDYFLDLDATFGPLTIELKKVFIETVPVSDWNSLVIPRELLTCVWLKAPQFKGYQQHDSHELLRFLLDGWSSEESEKRKQTNAALEENGGTLSSQIPSFVDTVFGGQVSSTVRCIECGHSSTVYEPYLDLSLPVPTKKPVSKKVPQVTRPRKPRQPPKKVGKNRPKLNRPVVDASKSKLPCQSQLNYDVPTAPTEEKVSAEENSEAVEESENKEAVADPAESISFSSFGVSWLDFVGPEDPLEDNNFVANSSLADYPVLQDSQAEMNALGNDVPFLSGTDSEEKNALVVNDVPLKSDTKLEGTKSPLENNIPSEIGTEDGVRVLPLNEEPQPKAQPQTVSINPWEDDIPLQVQDSEVLLLPYKEENCTSSAFVESEASSAIQDGVQEEFEGLGGLFDEPEEPTSHVIGPSIDVLESGFMATNSSESDPEEVDDSDSPVSVETCLTHFTKSELLSNDNAWHCENCSKILERPKLDKDNHIQSVADSNKLDVKQEDMDKEGNVDETKDEEAQGESNLSESYHTCGEQIACDQEGESKALNTTAETEASKDDETSSETVKVKRDAMKRVLINKAPPILTIHLKRFSQDSRGRLSKLKGHVMFKEMLDLKPYMDARCVGDERFEYRLVGVVEHQGGAMRHGHYISYVRGLSGRGNNDDAAWFHASDTDVRETDLEEVLRSEAYILFYEKV